LQHLSFRVKPRQVYLLNDARAASNSETFLDFTRDDNEEAIILVFLLRIADLPRWRGRGIDF
jgi:hypothetical protein